MNLRKISFALLAVALCLFHSARAGVVDGAGIGAYGDSLSWQYSLWVPLSTGFGYPLYSNGKQLNWVDHLVQSGYNFGAQVDATGSGNYYNEYDVAMGGAYSTDLPGQVAALTPFIQSGEVGLTALEIGGNDLWIDGFYSSVYSKASNVNYNPLTDPVVMAKIDAIVGNITSAVNATLALDPAHHMILSTVPDLGFTPRYRSDFPIAARRDDMSAVTGAINQRIIDLEALHGFPVIDAAGLAALSIAPPKLAGVQMQAGAGTGVNGGIRMYLSDGFHPGTVFNGLLANAVLKANEIAYGDVGAPISDQTIVTRAGLKATVTGPTYYDVSPYVIYTPVPEPTGFALAALAGIGFIVARRRRAA